MGMYAPKLNIGKDWEKVSFLSSDSQTGNHGVYYRVYVKKDGKTHQFFATDHQFNFPTYGKRMNELAAGEEFELRKIGGEYPQLELSFTE